MRARSLNLKNYIPNDGWGGFLYVNRLASFLLEYSVNLWRLSSSILSFFLISFQERNDIYFLAHMKARPSLFGLPIVVAYDEEQSMTGEELYDNVWQQVSRCLAADIGTSANHATDG